MFVEANEKLELSIFSYSMYFIFNQNASGLFEGLDKLVLYFCINLNGSK